MPTTYGPDRFVTARSVVVTELNALKARMVTDSIVPAIAAVYDAPLKELLPTFNACYVSIDAAETADQRVCSPGVQDQITCQVTIQIVIGNANAYPDEEKILQLCNSIINWFQERKTRTSDGGTVQWIIRQPFRATGVTRFEDLDAVGGLVEFVIQTWECYTQV